MLLNDKDKNLTSTAILAIILYAGLVMAIFYGVKGEWDAVFLCLMASVVAFYCKKQKR